MMEGNIMPLVPHRNPPQKVWRVYIKPAGRKQPPVTDFLNTPRTKLCDSQASTAAPTAEILECLFTVFFT